MDLKLKLNNEQCPRQILSWVFNLILSPAKFKLVLFEVSFVPGKVNILNLKKRLIEKKIEIM